MSGVSDSRFAMYEAMIALVWADHELDAEEKKTLHELIDGNLFFSDEQRAQLHDEVDHHKELAEVWPRITEKVDRARVLDIAAKLFHADGAYCETEQKIFKEFYRKHMESLDTESMRQEIQSFAKELEAYRTENEQQIKQWAKSKASITAILLSIFTGS